MSCLVVLSPWKFLMSRFIRQMTHWIKSIFFSFSHLFSVTETNWKAKRFYSRKIPPALPEEPNIRGKLFYHAPTHGSSKRNRYIKRFHYTMNHRHCNAHRSYEPKKSHAAYFPGSRRFRVFCPHKAPLQRMPPLSKARTCSLKTPFRAVLSASIFLAGKTSVWFTGLFGLNGWVSASFFPLPHTRSKPGRK